MPELPSGVRRSKPLDDLQPSPQLVDQLDNLALPVQNRTRRGGIGRGRGANAVGLAKGPSAAVAPARPSAAGRGRGIRLIDLVSESPFEALPGAAALAPGEPVYN